MLALLLGTLAGCAIFPADDNNSKQDATLTDALAALDALYKSENGKDGKNGYELVGSVTVGDTTFNVIWTTDNQSVTITKGDNGNYFVKLPTKNDEAAIYSLVATVTDTNGEREVYSFTQNLPVLTAGGNNKPTPPAQDDNTNTGDNNANTESNNGGRVAFLPKNKEIYESNTSFYTLCCGNEPCCDGVAGTGYRPHKARLRTWAGYRGA